MEAPYDIVVAGGGIAGMSAALAAARLGRRTLVLTGDTLGGQLASIEKVEGYPGFPDGVAGYDLCPMTQEQAEAAGAEIQMARVESLSRDGEVWRLATSEGDIAARGVVLAMGASLRKLGVPGEDRLFGKGVSHCAGCDGPLLRGRVAIVAGGGDSGMQEALTLAEHAAKVILFERGGALTGQPAYRSRVEANARIEVRFNSVVEEILGEAEVAAARVRDGAGATSIVETAAVFAYVGLRPETDGVAGLPALDARGAVPTDAFGRARSPGLCAAGNVRSGSPCRAVAAAGEGAAAAVALDRFLATGAWRDD